MNFIGIDNGVSGSIGIIYSVGGLFYKRTPVKETLNYTKKRQFFNRIDFEEVKSLFSYACQDERVCMIERPMINPTRWRATYSAIRALEATELVLQFMKIPYIFIDSKEWQRELLPKGLHKEELKIASLEVGKRLFPSLDFAKFDDADGILIAEYCRRKYTGGIK